MILRQVVDRIVHQTVLKQKSDVQKAFYYWDARNREAKSRRNESQIMQDLQVMRQTLDEREMAILNLKSQVNM